MDIAERGFTEAQQRALEHYGVDAQSSFVPAPVVGGRAHVITTGDGPPVVLLNGIGTPAAMWAPLMSHLDGLKLHGVDLPGFGLSDTRPDLTDDYRATAVAFLEQVLDGLGLDRPAFVTNSLGSLWTLWLAGDRPERVGAMVHLGCPALLLGTSAPMPMRMLSPPIVGDLMMRLQPPSPAQVERLAKMVHEHPLPSPISDLLLATERLPGFGVTFLPTLRAVLRPTGPRPEMTLTLDDLHRVSQPVQFIWGRSDPFGAVDVGESAARAVGGELHVVDGGHTPWLRGAENVAPMINEFLTRQR